MALSLSNFLYAICAFLTFSLAQAETVTYNWNVSWVTTNPDGLYERTTIGINNEWPLPLVNITVGDTVIVNMYNDLGNQSTSIHFHGLFQNGTTDMDGPVGVSQCGVPPGASFTYNFTVNQPGTYWYHSHLRGQYPDGFRGPVYVNDPASPYLGKYDEVYMMTLSDWYHEQMPTLLKSFISYTNPTGAEPVPDAALMNDSQNVTFAVEAGKTYLFHIVNVAAFAAQYLWFQDHTMQIVEVDGVWTEAQDADMIYVAAAQRYSVLITAKNDTSSNFAIMGSMDTALFDVIPDTLNWNVTGWLVYDDENDLPAATVLDEFDAYDDFYLVPTDGEKLWTDPTQTYALTIMMAELGNGASYAFLNGTSWVPPKVPTLYSVLTSGNYATDATIYGPNSNSFILNHNDVVEIVLNNDDSGTHPFHLHGHNFQAVVRSAEGAGYYTTTENATYQDDLPAIPMRRDTFVVRPYGHYVIRFRADNPGVWLYHCHIEWHVDSGLISTMIEAPLLLQEQLTVPSDHYEVCKLTDTPYAGNAAANTKDLLDLTGVPTSIAPLPAGFTAKGIVALVFSCISAFLGMAVIGWYGAAPLGAAEAAKMKGRIVLEDTVEPATVTEVTEEVPRRLGSIQI